MEIWTGIAWFGAGLACGALVVAPAGFKAVSALLRRVEDDLHPERRRVGGH